jgi:hypothetical protein
MLHGSYWILGVFVLVYMLGCGRSMGNGHSGYSLHAVT